MTISSTARVAGPFAGSGSAATFPFSFKVFEPGDIYVATLVTATGAVTELALTTDYTVTLNADQDTSPGGSITLTAGNLPTGTTLTLTTSMEALQGLDLANAGAFYPDTINAALDTLTILVQQVLAQQALCLQAPLVDGSPAVTLPPAAERAGMLPMFDGNGNLTLVSVTPGGTVLQAQAASGVVDGANTAFTFTGLSTATPVVLVFAGGVFQTAGDDYALSNLTGATWQATFTSAPTEGPITVVVLG